MLTNPPCISLLVGCTEGDTGDSNAGVGSSVGDTSGSNGQTSNGGIQLGLGGTGARIDNGVNVGANAASSAGSRIGTGISNGVNSTKNGLNAFGKGLKGSINFSSANGGKTVAASSSSSSGRSIFGPGKDAYAIYTLGIKNLTNGPLKGVVISHGPLPFGATFDPAKSSPACKQAAQGVECTVDLGPKEVKSVTVGYKAGTTLNCTIAKLLQSAKTSLDQLAGSANKQVSTTVTCGMKSEPASAAATGTAGASGAMLGAGAQGQQGVTQGLGGANGAQAGANANMAGHKPYTAIHMPATGAPAEFFAALQKHDFVMIDRSGVTESFSFVPLLLISCLSMIVLVALLMAKNRGFRANRQSY